MGWQHTIDVIAGEATLFAALGLLIGGADDLAVDLIWWVHRLWHRGRPGLSVDTLPAIERPGRLVVFIPAWDEAAVIGPMLMTALDRWRDCDLTILVGTYPNDPATNAAVRAIAARDPRVRAIMGDRPGPTTKADCLNTLWRSLANDDPPAGVKAIIIHDAEDVVHPHEPAVFAALIEQADVVQLPVLPLIHTGSAVSASYADDFAQAHATQLVVRTALGAGMPLAGTGCAIATEMLVRLAAERGGLPFDPDSLVEDYELGLRIAAMGGRGLFAPVQDGDGGLVAVRAYFPATLRTAVRQKTRWITGIALAGWDRTGWSRPLAIIDHWWRGRDRRTPLAMIVLATAWLAVPLWLASAGWHYARGTAAPAIGTMLATVLSMNAALLGWRLAMRGYLTGCVYGWRQGVAAVPRVFVSNLIALLAAGRAIGRYVGMLRGRPAAWDKTDHAFPVLTP